jgi:hypothetical protein
VPPPVRSASAGLVRQSAWCALGDVPSRSKCPRQASSGSSADSEKGLGFRTGGWHLAWNSSEVDPRSQGRRAFLISLASIYGPLSDFERYLPEPAPRRLGDLLLMRISNGRFACWTDQRGRRASTGYDCQLLAEALELTYYAHGRPKVIGGPATINALASGQRPALRAAAERKR